MWGPDFMSKNALAFERQTSFCLETGTVPDAHLYFFFSFLEDSFLHLYIPLMCLLNLFWYLLLDEK